jgi:hypothetical protein
MYGGYGKKHYSNGVAALIALFTDKQTYVPTTQLVQLAV